VHLKHQTIPVNPDDPQDPNKPINPNDPDSPNWPKGTDKDSLTKTVTETVHYKYANGSKAADDKTDSVKFNHEVIVDKVTGEIVKDNGWTAVNGDTTFDQKDSPEIKGYTPDQSYIAAVTGLTQDSANIDETVTYVANK
ncbi:transposase, partial [Lactobacillus plantarum]|uniref:mucin-binding protein n=1 Tax=Lactiplantibacillus plantarum TaxID=1590 RepID=UPI0016B111D2|nr:transposase [Lactiplantibacillus plantarum]NKI39664.1 transposase [Lactiplantibacillus plantarum]